MPDRSCFEYSEFIQWIAVQNELFIYWQSNTLISITTKPVQYRVYNLVIDVHIDMLGLVLCADSRCDELIKATIDCNDSMLCIDRNAPQSSAKCPTNIPVKNSHPSK